MINQELLNYIKGEIAKGVLPEAVKASLTSAGGWSSEDLTEAFNAISNDAPLPTSLNGFNGVPVQSVIKKKSKLVYIIIILIICGFIALALLNFFKIKNLKVSVPDLSMDLQESEKGDSGVQSFETDMNTSSSHWKKITIQGQEFSYPATWTTKPPQKNELCQTIACSTSDAMAGNWATKLIPENGTEEDIIYIGVNDLTGAYCSQDSTFYCYPVTEGGDGPILWTTSKDSNVITVAKTIVEEWKQSIENTSRSSASQKIYNFGSGKFSYKNTASVLPSNGSGIINIGTKADDQYLETVILFSDTYHVDPLGMSGGIELNYNDLPSETYGKNVFEVYISPESGTKMYVLRRGSTAIAIYIPFRAGGNSTTMYIDLASLSF